MCQDGLVCRGDSCVAETCSSGADCESLAPYCVSGLCGASCTDDSQCPGAAHDATDKFCVGGECVACRQGMNDCPVAAPICDMNMCRACSADVDCASNICDLSAGACVAADSVRYASPTGIDANDCSQGTPCTPTKAITIADSQHSWVRLLPGSYAPLTNTITITGKTLTLVGTGADWPGTGYLDVGASSVVTVRGLSSATYRCVLATNTSTLTLADVSSPMAGIIVSNCSANVLVSHLGSIEFDDGASLVVDRSLFTSSVRALVQAGSGLNVRVTNSIFLDTGVTLDFNQPINNAAISLLLAYNTFYQDTGNRAFLCPDNVAASSVVYSNNIFYAPGVMSVGGALQSAPYTTGGCTADTNIEYPEPTPVGANAIILDPKLVDAPTGNFHLAAGSPAIDAAKVIANDATVDFDGTARPQGARNDIGAFEYH
jgi:hypothetical protein